MGGRRRSRWAGSATGGPTSCTCTTGRQRSPPPTCTSISDRGARRRGTAAHDPQPRVPGPVPGRAHARALQPAGRRAARRRHGVLGRPQLPEGGRAVERRTSARSAPPTRARSSRPSEGMGFDGLLRAARPRPHRHRQRHRRRRVEPGHRPTSRRRRTPARRLPAKAANKAALQRELGLQRARRRARCSAWSAGSPPRRASTCCSPRCRGCVATRRAAGRARHRRPGAGGRASVDAAARPPRAGGHGHRLRRGALAPHPGGRRRHPRAVALRAVRPDPAVRPALRHAAGGGPGRRSRRHRHRRQRGGAARRRGHRRAVQPGRRRPVGRRHRAHRATCSPTRRRGSARRSGR